MDFLDPSRIDVDDALTARGARQLAADSGLRVVQTDRPLSTAALTTLDEELFATRPDVQFRVYGAYPADLSIARHLPHVRNFAADSLRTVSHIEALAELRQLESLSLGIYELDSFDVLDEMPATLRSLSLGQTRSKKPSLAHLERFSSLRRVFIEGHRSNIEVLGTLPMLEDLTLRSVTTPSLEFLKPLDRLWSLDIKLGGTKNLGAVEGMASIKHLELWHIRGLADVEVVAGLPGLQNLLLQSLTHVRSLPSLDRLLQLRRIVAISMKGLSDLDTLETAPALEDFVVFDGRHLQPEHFLPVLRNPTVRRVTASLSSQRKDNALRELLAEHGKESHDDSIHHFDYR